MTEWPMGDGIPGCPHCRGRGAVDFKPPKAIMPGVKTCVCVRERDIRANMERGWRGLSKVKPLKERTPLLDFAATNILITSKIRTLRAHVNQMARKRFPWNFAVYSDADLMDAWLSRIPEDELLDGDMLRLRQQAVSGRFLALVDLVEPPPMLILRVGAKAAKNREMPTVLLEALQHREQVDKPIWVVDDPNYPLTEGHISYSERVDAFLSDWPRLTLDDDGISTVKLRSEAVGHIHPDSPRPKVMTVSSHTASKAGSEDH